MGYKPTGYKPGRPKTGEQRPFSPGAEQSRRWREENYERSLEIVRESNARSRKKNPDKIRRQARESQRRMRIWNKTQLTLKVAKQNVKNIEDMSLVETLLDEADLQR